MSLSKTQRAEGFNWCQQLRDAWGSNYMVPTIFWGIKLDAANLAGHFEGFPCLYIVWVSDINNIMTPCNLLLFFCVRN